MSDLNIEERLDNILMLLRLSKCVLNIDEVSQYSGLSKSTIYKLTSGNKIPHFKKSKHLFFDRLEIESWLKSNRINTLDELDQEASNYVTLNNGEHIL